MQYGTEGGDYEKPHAITGIQRHWAEAWSELSQPQYSLLSTEASALDINGLAALTLAVMADTGAPFRNADGAETRPGFG